ncbi:hypothetical protein BDV95DRAFT_611926 [Massariosphaeria phaeospora]|uniref:Uncharacterized protein n=1 Tax=Massariosphaeria phaeospora TaxID=100035 RepID=A0A7C8HZB1_9PLEO|nr:hypothetical protein BDV95DRAFT_611926 [Massariosphaeria phaeospora]
MASENTVVTDLYDALETDPGNINIHERLLEAWVASRDDDMALGVATSLLQIDPSNECAQEYIRSKRNFSRQFTETSPSHTPRVAPGPPRSKPEQTKNIETELEEGYGTLKRDSVMLLEELKATSTGSPDEVEMLRKLQLIADGRIDAAIPMSDPPSAREAARNIMANQARAPKLLIEDFELVVHWMKNQSQPDNTDAIRDRLVRRRALLEAALPTSLSAAISSAFTAVERELGQRKYVNSTTMITEEPLSSIPRENFLVTEDNYAWDISELVSSISANSGIMRNPLSKQIFTSTDIHAILAHPLGQGLRPLQEAQNRMRKGFRPATLEAIEKLGKVMLQDQSSDGAPSRNAMDGFLAYLATLPAVERKAVDDLKVPAADRHTGQAYDYTVGEAVRDAKANTTCFHKVGDFLSQAAPYLRRQ